VLCTALIWGLVTLVGASALSLISAPLHSAHAQDSGGDAGGSDAGSGADGADGADADADPGGTPYEGSDHDSGGGSGDSGAGAGTAGPSGASSANNGYDHSGGYGVDHSYDHSAGHDLGGTGYAADSALDGGVASWSDGAASASVFDGGWGALDGLWGEAWGEASFDPLGFGEWDHTLAHATAPTALGPSGMDDASRVPAMFGDDIAERPSEAPVQIAAAPIALNAARIALSELGKAIAGTAIGAMLADKLGLTLSEAQDEAEGMDGQKDRSQVRGLPPEGISPPTDSDVHPGPASRPSEREKGGQSLWDEKGGEWRYAPSDNWHNPHWDYNPHDKPSSPWQNVPIGELPPRK
jgi:hypothetical protein